MKNNTPKINKQAEEKIDQFLNVWKEKAVKFYTETYEKYNELKKVRWNLMEEYKLQSHSVNYWRELESGQITQEQVDKYESAEKAVKDFGKSYTRATMSIISELPKYFEATLEKVINREMKNKKASLIARVTKKVGTITDASLLNVGADGNLNGFVTGENGKVEVDTIYAGGYNIQQLHYRVLVKNIK